MRKYLSEILELLGDDRGRLPLLVVLFLGASALDLAGIGLVGPYIALVMDARGLEGGPGAMLHAVGLPREQRPALYALGFLLLAVFAVKSLYAIRIQGSIIRFGQEQRARLQAKLMRSYQHMPYNRFLERNSAEYVYAIEGLTAEFAQVLQALLRAAGDAIVALAIIAFLAWQNPTALALLGCLLLVIVYGYDRAFRGSLREQGERSNRAATDMVQGIHEGIEGLKEVRILGKEGHFHRVVEEGAREYARHYVSAAMIQAAPRQLIEFALVAFVVLLVFLVLLTGSDPAALLPTLGMFGVAAIRLAPAASNFSATLMTLRFARAGVEQLHRDIAAVSSVPLEPSTAPSAGGEAFRSLELRNVRFEYPASTTSALDEISMEVRAHEAIGLVGPSGAGKTTLVDVLLGLLEPQQGELRYNDRPLRGALAEWRAQVAYLPQQVFLVDDSLRRNIALGEAESEIDEARIDEAVRQARLAELVEQLPDGVRTRIGERGVRLSGGQRQRVALARAFYHGRSVLVLDEATSALDNETEREIVEEIRRLKGTKTLIVIAHRLTTVQHCERIYRLENGRIVP